MKQKDHWKKQRKFCDFLKQNGKFADTRQGQKDAVVATCHLFILLVRSSAGLKEPEVFDITADTNKTNAQSQKDPRKPAVLHKLPSAGFC